MKQPTLLITAFAFCAISALPLYAQVIDTSRAISLVGSYGVSSAPRVLVLPMNFPGGDSIRAIIQRDFVNGNRIEVVRNADSLALPPQGGPDYAFFQQIGVHALVHVIPSLSGGINITLHDVIAKKNAGSRDFPLPGAANSTEWRWALHGVSDIVHEWIVHHRGIAQTRIAFIRAGSLWVVDSDGANARRVEGGMLLSPEWHPLEPVLAFSALVNGRAWQIGVKPLSGGPTRYLTSNLEGTNSAPSFSADGKSVYFQREDNNYGSIWTTPFNGEGTGRTIRSSRFRNASPVAQPSGGSMMFVTEALGNPNIFIMKMDGTDAVPFLSAGKGIYLESPAWSPNGEKIAYAARRGQDSHYQIEIADVRAKVPTLKTSSGENEGPSWAPDSRHIVYESTSTGVKQLWVMDTESGNKRQLTFGPEGAKNAAWSPRYR